MTTGLVSQFVCAANSMWKLPQDERQRLLERGVSASGAPRGLLPKMGNVGPFDGSTERVICEIVQNLDQLPDATVAKALLALAT